MHDNLYFVPILLEALERRPIEHSLRQAFHEITKRGKEKRFKTGYAQFLCFMEQVLSPEQRANKDDFVSDLETTAETLLEHLAACPELFALWDEMVNDIALESNASFTVDFQLMREGELLQTLSLSRHQRSGIISGLRSGAYELTLASGRILWAGQLSNADLLSAYARPEEPLRLAAATNNLSGHPTRCMTLFDGEVVVNVVPGPSTGQMEIEWCMPNNKS